MKTPGAPLRAFLALPVVLAILTAPTRAKEPDPKAEVPKVIRAFLAAPDPEAREKIMEQAAAFPAMPYTAFKAFEDDLMKSSLKPIKGKSGKRSITIEGKTFPFQISGGGGKGGKPAALIIYLHGSGGPDGQASFWSHPGALVVAPEAPPVKADGEREWTNGFTDEFFFELLRTLRKEYNLDPNRFYLAGFSAGGFGTWYYSLRFPDLLAAAFPMAGGPWYPDLTPEYPTDSNFLNLKYLPISIWHGALDKNVPVGPERKAYAVLQKLGYEAFYKEYPDGDHGDWFHANGGYIKKETSAWLDSKVRKPHPKEVSYYAELVISKVQKPIPGGAYWLHIVTPPVDSNEYKSQYWKAKISGKIEGQKVEVTSTANVKQGYVLLNRHLVDLNQPVEVVWNGKSVFSGIPECRLDTLLSTFGRAWDRELTYPVRIDFKR